MNNYFLIILLLFCCCGEPSKPTNQIIPKNDMKKILKERQWFIATCDYTRLTENKPFQNTDSILSSFHKNLGYSDAEFQQSLDFFINQNHDDLLSIYNDILQELSLESEKIKD